MLLGLHMAFGAGVLAQLSYRQRSVLEASENGHAGTLQFNFFYVEMKKSQASSRLNLGSCYEFMFPFGMLKRSPWCITCSWVKEQIHPRIRRTNLDVVSFFQ